MNRSTTNHSILHAIKRVLIGIIQLVDIDMIRYWNRLTIHIDDIELIIPTRLFYMIATTLIHIITLSMTYLLSDTTTASTTIEPNISSSSTNAATTNDNSSSTNHLGEEEDDDDDCYQDLPTDCVEISAEQAIQLQEVGVIVEEQGSTMRKRGLR